MLCAGIGGALWRQGYSVEEELRPPFISRAFANKLLRAGKTLNFLRWPTLPAPSCFDVTGAIPLQYHPTLWYYSLTCHIKVKFQCAVCADCLWKGYGKGMALKLTSALSHAGSAAGTPALSRACPGTRWRARQQSCSTARSVHLPCSFTLTVMSAC